MIAYGIQYKNNATISKALQSCTIDAKNLKSAINKIARKEGKYFKGTTPESIKIESVHIIGYF